MVPENLNLEKFIASGFYAGNSKFAPGTIGTIVAIPFAIFFNYFFNSIIYLLIILFLIIYCSFICYELQKIYKEKDPQWIVIDEIIGFFIATYSLNLSFKTYFFAFILFRLFDIFKPFGIKKIEDKLNCGFDIILDDCLAGLYTIFSLKILLL